MKTDFTLRLIRQDSASLLHIWSFLNKHQPSAVKFLNLEFLKVIPFFDGLIPEGFLLDVALKNWKLSEKDRMELLLSVCGDCIGAVSIKRIESDEIK